MDRQKTRPVSYPSVRFTCYGTCAKGNKNKTGKKLIECIFLGYSNESKAYRLFNNEKQKIVLSRDVIFFEKENKVIENDFNHSSGSISLTDDDESLGSEADDR